MLDDALDNALEEAGVDKTELAEVKTPDSEEEKEEQAKGDVASSSMVLSPKSEEEKEATASQGDDDQPEWG